MARRTFVVEVDITDDPNDGEWQTDSTFTYALITVLEQNKWKGSVWPKGKLIGNILHVGEHGIYRG